MSKNIYKEYLKKQKVKQKYDEEVVINEQKSFIKILLFLFEIIIRIFQAFFYIGILILCSIGATYIANKLGIFKYYEVKMKCLKKILVVCSLLKTVNCFAVTMEQTEITEDEINCYKTYQVMESEKDTFLEMLSKEIGLMETNADI